MEEQMKLLVNMLKDRINNNLQIIKRNEENIHRILLEPISNERSALLKENFNANRKLLEENHDTLIIELQLIKHLNKFMEVLKHQTNNTIPSSDVNTDIEGIANESFPNDSNIEQAESNDDVELLKSTILGRIKFNSNHPKFNNEEFFDNLLESFKQTENYEMCSQLLSIKGKK